MAAAKLASLRHATGTPDNVEATLAIVSGPALSLEVTNTSAHIRVVPITELNGTKHTMTLAPNSGQTLPFAADNGWYDLSITVDGYPKLPAALRRPPGKRQPQRHRLIGVSPVHGPLHSARAPMLPDHPSPRALSGVDLTSCR